MAIRIRFCVLCHKVGISEVFKTGKQLKHHVRDRHPQYRQNHDRKKLLEWRRKAILGMSKVGMLP